MASLSLQIPAPSVPFLDPSGNVSRAWFYFLLSLLNRTGGVPGVPASDLLEQIQALAVEMAMVDVDEKTVGSTFSVEAVMSDDVPPRSAVMPLDAVMTDPLQAPQPSPFLYALFVADAS